MFKKLYHAWYAMRQRCTDDTHPNYHQYGGRGIKVCSRWMYSLDKFIADMGWPASKELTLERKDNSRDYEPDNCVWVTQWDQTRNSRQVKLTPEIVAEIRANTTLTRRQLAAKYKVSYTCITDVITGKSW